MQALSYRQQRIVILAAFLFIPLTLLITFSYYPAAKLFQLSFTNWDGVKPYYEYVYLDNYISLFKDKDILKTLINNLAYVIIMFIQMAVALYFAIILDARMRAKNFFKSVIFMPYILNGVAVAFMFNYLYNYESSPINILLRNAGLENFAIRWLTDNYSINFSLAFIGMWRFTGLAMVIFLGALQSIQKELYEAASIDGADFFRSVWHITIPSIKRVVELNLFLGINGALQAFFEPYIITKGGPAGRSATFVTSTLDIAFKYQNFGKASAMGVVLLFLILLVIGIQRNLLGREGE